MIDLHTHLLFGLDDGPQTVEGSLELAAAMVADGVTIAACTPHVRDDHDTTPEAMEAALAELRGRLEAERIPLQIGGGGEIALDKLGALDAGTRARFGLGGNPKLLLLEFPYFGWPLALPSILTELKADGIVSVLAHPERNSEVQENPECLRTLVEAGAYVQLTADSVGGNSGPRVERCVKVLLDRNLAHLLASDWHGGTIRRAGMRSGARAAGGDSLAEWLTASVPRALLAGVPPPPRPPARTRRRWRGG